MCVCAWIHKLCSLLVLGRWFIEMTGVCSLSLLRIRSSPCMCLHDIRCKRRENFTAGPDHRVCDPFWQHLRSARHLRRFVALFAVLFGRFLVSDCLRFCLTVCCATSQVLTEMSGNAADCLLFGAIDLVICRFTEWGTQKVPICACLCFSLSSASVLLIHFVVYHY